MRAVLVIARNSLRGHQRNRVLAGALVVGLVLSAVSVLLAELPKSWFEELERMSAEQNQQESPRQIAQMSDEEWQQQWLLAAKALSFRMVTLVGGIVVIFFAAGPMASTLYSDATASVAARPVPRWAILLGQYLAVLVTVLLSLCVMSAGSVVAFSVALGEAQWALAKAYGLVLANFVVFSALIALLATKLSLVGAGLLAFLVNWFAGLTPVYRNAIEGTPESLVGSVLQALSWVAFALLPHSGDLSSSAGLLAVGQGTAAHTREALLISLAHTAAYLLIACWVYRRRPL